MCFSVCGTIDIRNNISNFEVLRGCQVIEGNLQIVLMTNRACKSCNELINNITFPELREVTGYVIFWRVQGLRSFGTLFPNLSVIRGKTLFHNYALVIYESKALQVIYVPNGFLNERGRERERGKTNKQKNRNIQIIHMRVCVCVNVRIKIYLRIFSVCVFVTYVRK